MALLTKIGSSNTEIDPQIFKFSAGYNRQTSLLCLIKSSASDPMTSSFNQPQQPQKNKKP